MQTKIRCAAQLSLVLLGFIPIHAQETISSQADARAAGLESLRLAVESDGGLPLPSDLSDFVSDTSLAKATGKALFHDMAIGSDGVQACVTCHFHAGADSRPTNQVNPGLLRVANNSEGETIGFHNAAAAPDETFHTVGPNKTLTAGDFPFVRNIGNGDNVIDNGGVLDPAPGNSNDVASSMGVLLSDHVGVVEGAANDIAQPRMDPVFNVDGTTVRRVEPRNTPTVINSVFNFHNFWDGRANHVFNGVNPFGDTDTEATIFRNSAPPKTGRRGRRGPARIQPFRISLDNASLASQAVGPPLSPFEMSSTGRTWPEIGRKVLTRTALADQKVHENDSLLASLRDGSGFGLQMTYAELIQSSFSPEFWESNQRIHFPADGSSPQVVEAGTTPAADTFTLMEANFALFFGLTVMSYEATLIADASPFDRWMESEELFIDGFGQDELAGLDVFVNKGKCANCHGGPEMTNASVRNAQEGNNIIEGMLMGDGTPAIYDNGYYNIGVTPTPDDLGRGGKGPGDKPLASSRQWHFEGLGIDDISFDIIGSPVPGLESMGKGRRKSRVFGFVDEDSGDFYPVFEDLDGDRKGSPTDRVLLFHNNVDGAFKTPGLRNIALTGPFMHNGGLATLMEVVEFYDRGGNFCRTNKRDLDPDIRQLGLTDEERIQLVAFMNALTDQRVVSKKAPFDTPQFFIPEGHLEDGTTILREIPANGADGAGDAIGTFLGLSNFDANPVSGETDSDGNVKCSPNFGVDE